MNRRIQATTLVLLIVGGILSALPAAAQNDLERKIDSLFVIASSGEVRYREMTEPAMDSIAALGVPAVPHLVDKFVTKSARERWTIIWILQRIGSPAVPHLIESLRRPDHLIVQRVCWALGDIKDSSAVDPLIAIAGHQRWQVRDQVIGALGRIGSKRADDVVLQALTDKIGQVRKAAVVSCGDLVIHEAIAGLVHALGDDFYGARMAAIGSLLKLDTTIVIETLIDSLDSGDKLVGNQICDMLGRYATDPALEVLYATALEDNSPERRIHAAVALIRADPLDNCGYQTEIFARQTDRLGRLKIESARYTARHGQEESAH